MRVAVIILNYNSSDDCRKCISFLKRQQMVDLEIIVVDNNSSDGDKVRVLCEQEKCTFIQSRENRGYNAGNNIGLRYAAEKGYEYALIANPDMEFSKSDYVLKLISAMNQNTDIVVVGSDIIGNDGKHQSPMFRDGNWTTSFGWITGIFKGKKQDTYDFIDNYTENHYCSKVSGCCLLVRMAFIKQIGFFDEYPFLYCEEAILSRQVEMAGKKMFYTVDTKAIHRHISSEKGNPIKRFKQWKRSRIYFINKYSGDCWLGKKISTLLMSVYVELFIFFKRFK